MENPTEAGRDSALAGPAQISTETESRDFLTGYLDCAAFCNVVTDRPSDRLSADELPADFRAQAERECAAFLDAHADDLASYCEEVGDWHGGPDSRGRTTYTAMECAGHDLAYSRNGHGTGYWDRGLGDLGTCLANAARAMGEHLACVELAAPGRSRQPWRR